MEWKKPASSNNGSGSSDKDWGDERTWKPTEPDELVGVLRSKRSVKANGEMKTVLTIEDANGTKWTVWCDRQALRDLVEENDAQLIDGRIVGLRTEGKITTDSGRSFYPYELAFGDASDMPAPTNNRPVTVPDAGEEPF